MCVKCAVRDAAALGDWDEVARLAREEKKAEKADEKAEAEAPKEEKATSSKASSK